MVCSIQWEELTGGRRVPPQKSLSLLGMTGKETYRYAGSVRTLCLQTIRVLPILLPFRFHLQSSTFNIQTSLPIMDSADLVYSTMCMNLQEVPEFFHDGENSSSGDSTVSLPSVQDGPGYACRLRSRLRDQYGLAPPS